MPPVTVFYHADCLDGFGAAYGAWRHFGDKACYRPLHHGEHWNLDEIVGHRVYILDFSFAPHQLVAMAEKAVSVIQIDHHASALQACASWFNPDIAAPIEFRHPTLPLHLFFDMRKSGVRLSWEYFNSAEKLPPPLDHIEDIDLWTFRLPGTREFCRALRLIPFEFKAWDELIKACPTTGSVRYREMLTQGTAIETFFGNEIERMANGRLIAQATLRGEPVDALQAIRHGQEIVSDGAQSWLARRGLAINASALFASELGNRLAEKSTTFGLVWQLAGDGEAKVSLRSQGSYDVGAIATRYGGGGHRNAAGFRMPLQRFLSEVLGLQA